MRLLAITHYKSPNSHTYEFPNANTSVTVHCVYSDYNDEFLYYDFDVKPIDSTKPYESNVSNLPLNL